MKRILIVDDEPTILKIMRVALEDRGYEVEIAHNGVQALRQLETFEADAVVTDIDMPQMNGRELCAELRKRYSSERLPVFVVTAKTSIEHRVWSKLIENVHFLEKPVSIRKLCSRLELAFERDSGAEAAR